MAKLGTGKVGGLVTFTIKPEFWDKTVMNRKGAEPMTMTSKQDEILGRAYSWFASLASILNDKDLVVPAVKVFGANMKQNFDSQGAMSGRKWQALSQQTRNLRQARGYNPDSPILIQSKQLYTATAMTIKNWKYGQRNGRSSGTDISMIASISATDNQIIFSAKASGAKVENQHGGSMLSPEQTMLQEYFGSFSGTGRFGAGYLPQRRFWFVDNSIGMQMMTSVNSVMMNDWKNADRGAKLVSMRAMRDPQFY